jgi:hypothetical protein
MASMPEKRMGDRCFGASLPMRITASWSGSDRIRRIQVCGAMIYKSSPMEAGSTSGYIMFLAQSIARGRLDWHGRPALADGIRNTKCASGKKKGLSLV